MGQERKVSRLTIGSDVPPFYDTLMRAERPFVAEAPTTETAVSARETATAHPFMRWGAPILIVAVAFLAFLPALDAGFVDWDDDDLLVNNNRYRSLNLENLQWMFTTSFFGHFQPLTWLSYAFDYAIWRGDPLGYHLTNVILHALTAVAFYFVARRLLACADAEPVKLRSAAFVISSAFVALLFACHPLRTESVAWLAERRDVLSGAFYVLSICCYLRYAMTDEASPIQRRWKAVLFLAAILACVFSLLAKATALTIFVVLLVLDVYPLRRLGGNAGLWTPAARRVWMEKVPFLIIGVAFAARALYAQMVRGTALGLGQHDVPVRLAQACHGLVFYLWKTIWPTMLGPLYPIPPRAVLFGPTLWISVLIVVGLGFVAWRWRRVIPGVAAALAVYAVTVSPVLGFAQAGPQFVADRYSYLSCLGFPVLAGWLVQRGVSAFSGESRVWHRSVFVFGAAVVVTVLMMMTYRQSAFWKDALTLWGHGVRVSPHSSVAHCNYADALSRAKRYAEALPHYERAMILDPKDPVALHHMGDLHYAIQKPREAIEYYRRTLAVAPNRRTVPYILGHLLVNQGQYQEALAVLRDGARRDPTALDTFDLLADLLATFPDPSLRNGEEAVFWASKASAARSHTNPWYLLTLATAVAEAGRFEDAVQTAERAVPLAVAEGDQGLAAELQRRLRLFRDGKPYHYGD